MSVQAGIQYTLQDGSLTDAGYALLRDQEDEIATLKEQIAQALQILADNGLS
jgi:CRISPR/Cas system CSM-associated protein Csm4 (group 5 of RAMP superfamily)